MTSNISQPSVAHFVEADIASAALKFDPRSLEIKTRSIEQTLVPLVSQITTLVNHRERYGSRPKTEKAARAVMKVGSAVQAAVERFVTVGETIADENPDIQPEMYDACHEARSADRVLVKQILKAEDKVAYSLTRLENTNNFTEFVKIFTQFGGEMVDLAHRTGDRQHDLKSEKRRAQLQVARNVLERYTMLLLTSSKTLLRHPDCESARQTRDGVFRQMRTALQLVGLCVTDGILTYDPARYFAGIGYHEEEPLDIGLQLTANAAIKQLLDTLEMVRMTSNVGSGVRERLVSALEAVSEMTQDFTDSAYTPHHHREQILDFLEESRFELGNVLKPELEHPQQLRNEGIEVTVQRLTKTLKDLRKQLQIVSMDHVSEVFRANEDHVILNSIKACSVSGDIDGVEQYIEKFREHAEHMQECCRLLHHISLTDALHVQSGHAERNLRALAPLVKKHGSTAKPLKPVVMDVEDQQKMAKVGLEMKFLTSEVDAEAEKWDEYAENDIVKKAKNMSSMAFNMYLFTRGDGPLKTTHDLFTQAEFFAEEANKMYKTVREFSYEVPGSAEKNDLLQALEKIPVHCQQLQVLVKSPTVGKTQTFNKVDGVIQETKNLMNEIAKLVTACFLCATKFEIEFRGASISASRSPFADGDIEIRRQRGDSSPWRRTPSMRRSQPQHRSTERV